MMQQTLQATVQTLATPGRGILAADESTATITKRFEAVGVTSNEDTRRAYRELLLTAPHISDYIAGVILYEETLNQTTSSGIPFPKLLQQQGILPGIKVDKGLITLSNTVNKQVPQGEQITQGLDGLAERLRTYREKGAVFAKWRAVYAISDHTPSRLAIEANAEVLARYAAICQNEDIVPIVEPEVLIDGAHTLEACEAASIVVLQEVFEALARHKVILEYTVLKPSMVIHGKACKTPSSMRDVAEATVRVLKRIVPAALPTINFLSGGQTTVQATAHLNAMHHCGLLPWNVSFSYARALQDDAMKMWAGSSNQVKAAQAAFIKRAKLNSFAAKGSYTDAMEQEALSIA